MVTLGLHPYYTPCTSSTIILLFRSQLSFHNVELSKTPFLHSKSLQYRLYSIILFINVVISCIIKHIYQTKLSFHLAFYCMHSIMNEVEYLWRKKLLQQASFTLHEPMVAFWEPNSNLLFSFLEKRVLEMEDKHTLQLKSIKDEKDQLQVLVARQNSIIEELEKQLVTATVNNSVLQKQQHDLMETVHNLLTMISTPNCK